MFSIICGGKKISYTSERWVERSEEGTREPEVVGSKLDGREARNFCTKKCMTCGRAMCG